jgi:RNA polymerase sigma-70 factor (ECF subfamily)
MNLSTQHPPNHLAALDDADLVEATLRGDYGAFEQLFLRHSDRVYSVAMGILRDEAEAQDALQESFLSAFRKLASFRRESPFRAWLLRITTNTCLMRLRSRRRRPEVPLEVRSPSFADDGHFERTVVDWSPLAEKALEDHELGERLRAAVEELPEKYRVVLMLADYEHLSMQEIAELLHLTVPAVKTRLHRARLGVREAVTDYLDGRT